MKAEQFIKDYTRHCSNELCAVEDRYGKKVISYHEWLTPDQALRVVEIAREEIMAKVCEWLDLHMPYGEVDKELRDEVIDDLKKVMGGE